MKRSLFGALAAVALLTAPAAAQDALFQYNGPGPANPFQPTIQPRTGQFVIDYAGGDVLSPPAIGTTFMIFCVDQSNNAPPIGTQYNVWVTGIAASNAGLIATNTRLGLNGVANAYDRYWRAAWIVSDFTTAGSLSGGSYTSEEYQWAVWAITNNNAYLPGNAGALVSAALAATVDATGFGDWGVITNTRTPNYQEFIYFQPGGGLEIVPEPATMTLLATGLAGMAAANRRRRNKK
jgi:hypothetical protein